MAPDLLKLKMAYHARCRGKGADIDFLRARYYADKLELAVREKMREAMRELMSIAGDLDDFLRLAAEEWPRAEREMAS